VPEKEIKFIDARKNAVALVIVRGKDGKFRQLPSA